MKTCSYDRDTATDVAVLHTVCLFVQQQRGYDLETMKRLNKKKKEKGLKQEYSEHDFTHNEELHKEVLEWQKKPVVVAALEAANKKIDETSSKELVFSKSDEMKSSE